MAGDRGNDMKTGLPGLVVHEGTVVSGEPRKGDSVWAVIDVERRWDMCPEPHRYSPFTHGSA